MLASQSSGLVRFEGETEGFAQDAIRRKQVDKKPGCFRAFQDLESLEVICGVLQAAILDSCQQVAELVYF